MTKRAVKGLNETGRVSVKRTQAASALIQQKAAKKGGPSKGGETHVTVGRTATGKKTIAFRVGAEHRIATGNMTTAVLRTVTADQG